MRYIPTLLAVLAFPALGLAQTGVPAGYSIAGQTGTPPSLYDANVPAEPQVPKLYAAWKAERNPDRRASIGSDLVDAIIHEFELPQVDIADEVARDGLPIRILTPPEPVKVRLTALEALKGVRAKDDYPASPVLRRVAADRVEAWTSGEGWLFNGKGHLLTHVKVPRRDGTGREWFGAFLPDGTWITTDLWDQDEQINAFNAHGKWLWELKGTDILKHLPPPSADTADPNAKPLICWARADRIGQGWVVCVGEDWNTTCALVAESRTVAPIPDGENEWGLVYPRAMGTRGFPGMGMGISSDDGKDQLGRDEPMHGIGVGWPKYFVTLGNWSRVIYTGDRHFGFWPRSHAVFIETLGNEFLSPHRVWFFDDAGRYAGQITGSYLGDAANKYGLLVTIPGGGVATIMPDSHGTTATQVRAFTWPDGSRAVPLALYDDLHLGFFLRGPEISDSDPQTADLARAAADIVLARWRP